MTQELEQILSGLELEQLKDLAQRYGIDCSGCVNKEEFIAAILNSQMLQVEDLRTVIGTGPIMGTITGDESKPKFEEAQRLLQETKNTFDSGDYIATIDKATKAIDLGSKVLSDFYGIGLSYAIRSSENMIETVKDAGIDSTQLEQILGQARQTFENRDFESAGSILTEIRTAIGDLYKKHSEIVSDLIETTGSMLEEVKGIGSDVIEAEIKLQEARELLASESLTKALDSIKEAESLAKTAQQNRIQEISNIITGAGEVIEEAKYLNAPVSEAEGFLEAAKSAFDSENYNSAVENANKASEFANAAKQEQIQKVMSIQEKVKPMEAEMGEFEVPISTEEEEIVEMVEEKAEEIIELAPTEVANVCPNCGGEPTYVEQYQRYYCYNCSEYVEPKEKAVGEVKEEVAEPTPTELAKVCPNCGGEPTYVDQYQRYYCYTCTEYVEPIEKAMEEKPKAVTKPEPAKVCPNCGGEPTYVDQYQRHYCYTCSEYVEPIEKGKEEKPKAVMKPEPAMVAKAAKVCPNCGGEPTYVDQYQRYYCYTCNEYVEPTEKAKKEKPKVVTRAEPAKAVKVTKVCSKCGGEPTYVDQYQRYYCYTCSEYVQPIEKAKEEKPREVAKSKPAVAAKVCPNCSGEPTYVEQYQRYYCYNCNTYVEPVQKTPQKSPSTTACPTCGGQPTYVEQYKRYYCYTCNKYL